jgi:hypothetical protein
MRIERPLWREVWLDLCKTHSFYNMVYAFSKPIPFQHTLFTVDTLYRPHTSVEHYHTVRPQHTKRLLRHRYASQTLKQTHAHHAAIPAHPHSARKPIFTSQSPSSPTSPSPQKR